MLKSQWTLKIETHNVFTGKVNKIALSFIDDERLQ